MDAAVCREFAGVAQQVEQDLPQFGDIGMHGARVHDLQHQPVTVLVHQRFGGIDHTLEQRAHLDRLQVQLHLARLDLGQIQHVVDQPQQMLAGNMNLFQIRDQFNVAIVHGLLGQQLAVTNDRVQRRAQLVAHIGQKHALGVIGGIRRFPGLFQLRTFALKRQLLRQQQLAACDKAPALDVRVRSEQRAECKDADDACCRGHCR